MGLRFITGYEIGTESLLGFDFKKACLYCSTSGVTFGPVFTATEDQALTALEVGQGFLQWCQDTQSVKDGDVRIVDVNEIINLHAQYCNLSSADQAGWFKRFKLR